MTDIPEYLFEIDAYNGSTVVTLRYSSSGYTTWPSDTPTNTYYDARISTEIAGTLRRSLFGERRTTGIGEIGYGEFGLVNADGGLDALLAYGFDGRAFVVKRLDNKYAAYSTAVTVLRGTIQGIDATAALGELRFRLYDRMLDLDDPVQSNVYAGTTTSGGATAEGSADMKDQPKPLCFGRCTNVSPVPANAFDLIYQVNDGAVSAITVYDGQVPLTFKADYASIAALQGATIKAGQYGTCLALGLFRLGRETYFTLTADVTEGATLADRNASKIVERILSKMGFTGGTNIDSSSFAAFASASPQEIGLYLTDDTRGNEAIGRVLASVGGYIVALATGPFSVGIAPVIGTATWSLDLTSIEGDDVPISPPADTDKGLPAYRTILRYGRSWTVLAGAQMSAGASTARRGYARTPFRKIKDQRSAVLTTHPLAPELIVETLLLSSADAAAEATRRADLYSVDRYIIEVTAELATADAMTLASTGAITLERFGWAPKNFVVIDREDDFAAGDARLTLWG